MSTPKTAVLEKNSVVNSGLALRALKIVGFALATAAAAQIKFPMPGSPVPITFQTAIVLLAGLRLGAKDGAVSQVAYILGGTLGLPFFAGGAFGLAALMGPTGGYLLGFVLAAFVIGALRNTAKSLLGIWVLTLMTSLILFIPGVLQLKTISGITYEQALLVGFFPFIVGDLIKVGMTASTHWTLNRLK